MITGPRRGGVCASAARDREAAVGGPEAVPEASEEREKSPEVALQPPRRPDSERLTHQQPEVEGTAVNEQAFEDVLVTAKMSAPHASCSVEVSEGSFGSFPPETVQALASSSAAASTAAS